jgi:hypothetical protein
MVAFDLKATIVALIFALILGAVGLGIRFLPIALFVRSGDEPAWSAAGC